MFHTGLFFFSARKRRVSQRNCLLCCWCRFQAQSSHERAPTVIHHPSSRVPEHPGGTAPLHNSTCAVSSSHRPVDTELEEKRSLLSTTTSHHVTVTDLYGNNLHCALLFNSASRCSSTPWWMQRGKTSISKRLLFGKVCRAAGTELILGIGVCD